MGDPLALVDTEAVLRPFLDAINDSLSSIPTVRALVLKTMSSPDVFCGFDQIKALLVENKIDDGQLMATLDLFSYGNYATYSQNPSAYMPLNDKHISKMRQLTLISCVQEACERGQASLSYASICEAVGLSEHRDMEQVIVSCLYNRALNGKLCQKTCQLLIPCVPPCISRDVPLSNISDMLQQLQTLQTRLSTTHSGLEDVHTDISKSLSQSESYWKSVQERQAKTQGQIHNIPGGGGGGTSRLVGWSESNVGARRPSASRQSKRSRAGPNASFTEPLRY